MDLETVEVAEEKQRQVHIQEGPYPSASSSKASSFCSFDVRIWEELHLQSLNSVTSSNEEEYRRDKNHNVVGQLWKSERKDFKTNVHPQGVSYFSSSARASLSGLSSPHRLSNASSTTGYPSIYSTSKRESTSMVPSSSLYKSEQLPVVKVIQTGSMSFTSEELVLQLGRSTDEPYIRPEKPAETPLSEEEEKSPVCEEESLISKPCVEDGRNNERSVVMGSLSKVKFLQIAAPDVYTAAVSPLKPAGAIPFKWEEVPGKPKLCTDSPRSNPTSSLQLPPKLLYPSSSSLNCTSPYSRSYSKHTSSSPSSLDDTASKPTSVRSLWQSFMQSGRRSYREGCSKSRLNRLLGDEDPWSPTSTLLGPDAGLSSSSSTSSTLDAVLCTSPGLPELQSSRSAFNTNHEISCPQSNVVMPSSSSSLCEASSLLGNNLPNLAPSMERRTEHPLRRKATDKLRGFLKSCQNWKSLGSHRKRNHEEAEMWAPTLATYFHSMELERSSSVSGQSLLVEEKSIEKQETPGKFGNPIEPSFTATIDVFASNYSKGLVSTDVPNEDMVVFSAKSTIESSTLGLKGKKAKIRRRAGGWVLRKLRRSSRLLAATWTAVASTKKLKRRKLPYQHVSGEEFCKSCNLCRQAPIFTHS